MKDFEEFLSLVRKRTEQRKKAEADGQAQQLAVSSLSAVLPSGDGKEINLGTVASPQVQRAATPCLADRLDAKQAETFCLTAAERGQESKASGGNQTECRIKEESAAAVSPDALQGVLLSDQENADSNPQEDEERCMRVMRKHEGYNTASSCLQRMWRSY